MADREDAALAAIPLLSLGGVATTRLARALWPAGDRLATLPLVVGLLSALAVIGFETLVRPPGGD